MHIPLHHYAYTLAKREEEVHYVLFIIFYAVAIRRQIIYLFIFHGISGTNKNYYGNNHIHGHKRKKNRKG